MPALPQTYAGIEALSVAIRVTPSPVRTAEPSVAYTATDVVAVSRITLRNLLVRIEMLQRTRDLNAVCSSCRRTLEGRSPWNPENHTDTCEFMQLASSVGLRFSPDVRSDVVTYAPYTPLYATPDLREWRAVDGGPPDPVAPVVQQEGVTPSRAGEDE